MAVTEFVIYNTEYHGYLISFRKAPGERNELHWKPQLSQAMRMNYTDAMTLKEELHLEHCILRGVR